MEGMKGMVAITRIGVMSLAKFFAGFYAIIGIVYGLIVGLFMLLVNPLAGIASIVGIPILMGIVGFILGGLMALVANFVFSQVGGICIETGGACKPLVAFKAEAPAAAPAKKAKK